MGRATPGYDVRLLDEDLLGYLAGRRSTQTGSMASMTDHNKDALKAILQLILSGLKELISMIGPIEGSGSENKQRRQIRADHAVYHRIGGSGSRVGSGYD